MHVKGQYFEEIKSGKKPEEYRIYNTYWYARLNKKIFDEVHVLKGYPKKTDLTRKIVFPWNGYRIKQFVHKEFAEQPVIVYAIKLSMTKNED